MPTINAFKVVVHEKNF